MTDWATLEHAYGRADEVADLLAAIRVGTEPEASEAVDELFTVLYHQGSTYSATDAAVPHLVDLALRGPEGYRPAITSFLGSLAREDAPHATIKLHLDQLVALIDDDNAEVREPAAWLLAEYAGFEVTARLAGRYAQETDAMARASLLVAVGHEGAPPNLALARSALGDVEPAVRVAAALVIAWAGETLPEHSVAAVATSFDEGSPVDGWSWTNDPVGELLRNLAEPEPLCALLVRCPDPTVRAAAAWAIADVADDSGTGGPLVPLLALLITDPDGDVRLAAIHAAQEVGSAALAIADALATAAEPLTGADDADLDQARNALHVLITIRDPRWRPLVIAAWERGSAHDDTADVVRRSGAPGDPQLRAAVEARIQAIDTGVPVGRVRYRRAASPASERASLTRLLTSWTSTGDEPAAPA